MGTTARTLELDEDEDWIPMEEDPIGHADLVEPPELPRYPASLPRPLDDLLFNVLF
jgi:hypothetical protein